MPQIREAALIAYSLLPEDLTEGEPAGHLRRFDNNFLDDEELRYRHGPHMFTRDPQGMLGLWALTLNVVRRIGYERVRVHTDDELVERAAAVSVRTEVALQIAQLGAEPGEERQPTMELDLLGTLDVQNVMGQRVVRGVMLPDHVEPEVLAAIYAEQELCAGWLRACFGEPQAPTPA
jgi:hypothetical protein